MNRSGWAYGECVGSQEWLTILGSYWRAPVLHATPGEARAALDGEPYRDSPHLDLVIRHVTEVAHGGVSGGYAFRITSPQPGCIEDGACPRCGDLTEDSDTCTVCGYVSGSSTGENDSPPA